MVAAPKIALTDEEITILKSYKRSRFSLVQHKAEALLLLNGNIDINFIADFLDRRPSTVTTWAKDYQRIRDLTPVWWTLIMGVWDWSYPK